MIPQVFVDDTGRKSCAQCSNRIEKGEVCLRFIEDVYYGHANIRCLCSYCSAKLLVELQDMIKSEMCGVIKNV